MQFIYSPLTWGFLLALVPLLIHLINLMRHQRVQWAAMEFLLESYRRHRRWIWLKQFLLLLLRMLVVAGIVAMLANLVTREQWWQIFSGQTTHHFLVVDDTLSMADSQAGDSAFLTAQRIVGQIIAQSARQTSPQRLTLLRVSQADIAADREANNTGPQLDLVDQVVDSEFDVRWEDLRRKWTTSQLGMSPRSALELVAQQVAQVPDQRTVVYMISDYRQRDWQDQAELNGPLQRLQQAKAELHAIRCVAERHQNLAISRLELAPGTVAAGVPMFAEVAVHNYGSDPVEEVELALRTHWYASPNADTPQVDELPKLVIDRIEPGETVMRQAQVFFPSSGQHVVEAYLPNDAVVPDNRRWMVVNLPETTRVLVVDGDAEQRNVFYLQAVFQPGERAVTGIEPDIQSEAFLRNVSREQLAQYDTIYLLDLPRLEASTVQLLDSFVHEGGGLAIYAGPDWDISFYNRLQSEFQVKWLPLNLTGSTPLPPADYANAADVVALDNPIFRVLASRPGQPNPFARSLRLSNYIETDPQTEGAEATVLAETRGGSPLVAEQLVGRGRVITWLTTLAPQWNNWAFEPTFPVVLLQQQARLAAGRSRHSSQPAGTPLRGALDVSRWQRGIDVILPATTGSPRIRLRRQFDQEVSDITQSIDFQIGAAEDSQRRTGETDTAGVAELVRTSLSGDRDVVRYALNPDDTDGNLELADRSALTSWWENWGGKVHDAADWTSATLEDQRESWSQSILVALLIALVLEQVFAYACSYHVSPGARS